LTYIMKMVEGHGGKHAVDVVSKTGSAAPDDRGRPQLVLQLQVCDGTVLEVEEGVALQSDTLRPLLLGDDHQPIATPRLSAVISGAGDADRTMTIPVPNISPATLAMLIHFYRHHSRPGWSDSRFLDGLGGTAALCDLAVAADYLQLASLLHLTCQTLADKLKRKSLQDIQRIFQLDQPTFTPQQEEELFRENQWAFDGNPI
ncbi:hypothetical protein GOP47_0020385, partial [Adiantum capillus-veneris]